jgi:hypothetical protein
VPSSNPSSDSRNHQKQAKTKLQMYQTMLFIFQLWLASLAFAAPIADETFTTADNTISYGTGGGIVGLIVLILDVLVFSMFSP